MSLARNKKKGRALTVIEVDQALDTEVMETLRSVPGIQSATGVTM
jgi:hypothetical protein